MTTPLERDWAFVREAHDVLEDYLLSSELFWPLSGAELGSPSLGMLQFTLGNLALSLRRLSAVQWPPEQAAELATRVAQVEAIHNRWRANWSQKTGQEYRSRLKQWTGYLNEALAEQGRRSSGYAYQVRLRAILELLQPDLPPEDSLQVPGQPVEALAQLDRSLRALTRPAVFVWEPEVQPAFPASPYWYLYVQLRENR